MNSNDFNIAIFCVWYFQGEYLSAMQLHDCIISLRADCVHAKKLSELVSDV